LAKLAVVTHGRTPVRDGRLEHPSLDRLERSGQRRASTLTDARESITRRQKKARLGSRADKGLEIFFVNEKVCFGKQKFQYSGLTAIDYSHN
jgi:hypothetical protein